MKFFTNKSVVMKIVISLVIIILFQFIITKPSLGIDASDYLEFGGKLIQPIFSLLISIGDAVMSIIHSSIMGIQKTLHHVDLNSSWWENLFKPLIKVAVVAGIVVACAAAICLAPVTGGTSLAAAFAAGEASMGMIATALFANMSTLAATAIGSLAMFSGLGDTIIDGIAGCYFSASSFANKQLPLHLYLPSYSISPEEIFQGKILLFNVDFFTGDKKIHESSHTEVEDKMDYVTVTDADGTYQKWVETGETIITKIIDYYYYVDGDDIVITSKDDIGVQLKSVVSKWYVSLRNIGFVMMLIILLYIGIRMIISTVASDKAKYKQLIFDWLMGMVLLFTMHYIMLFANVIVNSLTKVISSSVNTKNYVAIIQDDKDEKISKFINELEITETEEAGPSALIEEDVTINGEKGKVIKWYTNLMGIMRIKAQMSQGEGLEYIGYAICFCLLVCLTISFIFTYLKRVLYMAFLTVIAPLVAVTYPIDKVSDGTAQGFNKWFKEYIFTLLIQPLHLLLYYVLVTAAFELASANLIYSIVALYFMIPAEKILRNFFGFEKASTPGLLQGTTGAVVTMGAIGMLGKMRGPQGDKKIGSANKMGEDDSKELEDANYGGINEYAVWGDGTQNGFGNIGNQSISDGSNNQEDNNNLENVDNSNVPVNPDNQSISDGSFNLDDNDNLENTDILNGFGNIPASFSNSGNKSDSDSNKKLKRKLKLATAGAGKAAVYSTKGAAKLTKMAMPLVLGGAGAIAGLASGDPSNIFKYGATAWAAGNSFGGAISSNVNDNLG